MEDAVRALKFELEERLRIRIPIDHPIVAWIVPHAADLINKMERKDIPRRDSGLWVENSVPTRGPKDARRRPPTKVGS